VIPAGKSLSNSFAESGNAGFDAAYPLMVPSGVGLNRAAGVFQVSDTDLDGED